MKALHASGKLGRPAVASAAGQKSGQVRSERASQIAQSLAQKHADKIEAAFLAGMRSKSEATRVRAAEGLLKLAQTGQRQESAEVVQVAQQHSREDLLKLLSEKLTVGPTAAIIRGQIESAQIVDAEVVDA